MFNSLLIILLFLFACSLVCKMEYKYGAAYPNEMKIPETKFRV